MTRTLTNHALDLAVSSALDYLVCAQREDGSFSAYSFADRALTSEPRAEASVFSALIVADALSGVNDERAQRIIARVQEFLVNEMVYPGIWRYFARASTVQFFPDLDDTCCASVLLKRAHPYMALGMNVPAILNNRNAEGLFLTWLKPDPAAANDVDCVVNANVLWYLGARDETRPVIDRLNRIIAQGRERESLWYYTTPLALYYALARAYATRVTGLEHSIPTMRARIAAQQHADASWGNALETALAVATLGMFADNEPISLHAAQDALMRAQLADGSWQACSYYIGIDPPGPPRRWYGSSAETTALCVRALAIRL